MRYIFLLVVILTSMVIFGLNKWNEFSRKHTSNNGVYDLIVTKGGVITGTGELNLFIKGPKIVFMDQYLFYRIEVDNGLLKAKFQFNDDGIIEIRDKWPYIKGNEIEFYDGYAFDNSVYLECIQKVHDYSLCFDIVYNPLISGSLNINNWGKRIVCGDVTT